MMLFDFIREFIESQFVGSTALAVLIACAIAIVFLLIMGAGKEVIFLVPLPMFISLGILADSAWLSVIAYILAGVYLSKIILAIGKEDKG